MAALGTAIRRHRLYPASNPLCTEAVTAALGALADMDTGSVEIAIGPEGVRADRGAVADTPIVRDLEEALFRADLESVAIPPEASAAEIARFCTLVARWSREPHEGETFADALLELGVTGIQVRLVERARLIGLPALDRDALAALVHERARRPDAGEEPEVRLHRGWVRADTDCDMQTLDLVDLAFLCREPRELARLLERMSEGAGAGLEPDRLLADRVGELMQLYRQLSPEQANRRLADLGDTILTLPEDVRRELLAERLLPELLDTGGSAPLLRRLPDDELSGALERLARRALGSVGIVELALARLELPRSRAEAVRAGLASVLDESPGRPPRGHGSGDRVARIGFDDGGPVAQSLRAYTALDLAVTDEIRLELARIRDAATARDDDDIRLGCLTSLVSLARNPDRIDQVLRAAEPLIGRMLTGDPAAAVRRVSEWVGIAEGLREARPDVTEAIEAMLRRILTPDLLQAEVGRLAEEAAFAAAVAAFGPVAAEPLLTALEVEPDRRNRRVLLDFACRSADRIAEGVAARVGDARWTVQRNVARILGFAGASHEASLCFLMRSGERRVTREAILALARIGSPEAADAVVQALYDPDPEVAAMAEESMRRFPRVEARRRARELLSDPVFYTRRPRLARDLLRRFVARDPERLTVLEPLVRLRLRWWRPAVAGLGWMAWSLARRRAT